MVHLVVLARPTPTKIFDVTTFGANESHADDDTVGIQAAIDAAANAGDGAMAYLPAGQYHINKTLEITGKDFWVGGSGLASSIAYSCPRPAVAAARSHGVTLCPDAGPALRVSAASNVAIEMMQMKAPSSTDQLLIQGGTGIHSGQLSNQYREVERHDHDPYFVADERRNGACCPSGTPPTPCVLGRVECLCVPAIGGQKRW